MSDWIFPPKNNITPSSHTHKLLDSLEDIVAEVRRKRIRWIGQIDSFPQKMVIQNNPEGRIPLVPPKLL